MADWCVPGKYEVVWKDGWEEEFNDSDREPTHQQGSGAKKHLDMRNQCYTSH